MEIESESRKCFPVNNFPFLCHCLGRLPGMTGSIAMETGRTIWCCSKVNSSRWTIYISSELQSHKALFVDRPILKLKKDNALACRWEVPVQRILAECDLQWQKIFLLQGHTNLNCLKGWYLHLYSSSVETATKNSQRQRRNNISMKTKHWLETECLLFDVITLN